jgi:hypothetical protein
LGPEQARCRDGAGRLHTSDRSERGNGVHPWQPQARSDPPSRHLRQTQSLNARPGGDGRGRPFPTTDHHPAARRDVAASRAPRSRLAAQPVERPAHRLRTKTLKAFPEAGLSRDHRLARVVAVRPGAHGAGERGSATPDGVPAAPHLRAQRGGWCCPNSIRTAPGGLTVCAQRWNIYNSAEASG